MVNDAWLETAYLTITKEDGSDREFRTILDECSINPGSKDIEGIPTLAGGRIVKFTPQGDGTITLSGYALEAGTDTGSTGKGFMDLIADTDASQPLVIPSTLVRNQYRIAILWTDDSTVTGAAGAVASGSYGLRFVAAEGYFTEINADFTDDILKFSITFKFVPFDKAGSSNFKWESCDATTTLDALAAYTSSAKW